MECGSINLEKPYFQGPIVPLYIFSNILPFFTRVSEVGMCVQIVQENDDWLYESCLASFIQRVLSLHVYQLVCFHANSCYRRTKTR
jgi:hypothetical protein